MNFCASDSCEINYLVDNLRFGSYNRTHMFLGLWLFLVVQVIVLIWLGGLTFFALKAIQTYQSLTSDIDKKNMAEVLKSLKKRTKKLETDTSQINDILDQLKLDLKPYVQKIGFVRYNPFGNTGGDQSFCLCLLDDRGNGILITSLHARQQTRIYTKEIVNNQPKEETELSKEERKCLQIAQKWSK